MSETSEQLTQALDRLEGLRAGMKTPGPYECDAKDGDLFTWVKAAEDRAHNQYLAGTSGRMWISDAASVVADLNAIPGLIALVRCLMAEREAAPVGWMYKKIVDKHLTGDPLEGEIQIDGVWGRPSDHVYFSTEPPADPWIWWQSPVCLPNRNATEAALAAFLEGSR